MPKVSAVTVHYILKSIEQQTGLQLDDLIAQMGIEAGVFAEANARIESEKLATAFRYAMRRAGDPDLALHIGESVPYQALGLLGYLLLHADTVAAMFEKFRHYQKLIAHRLKFHIRQQDGGYVLAVYLSENPHLPVPAFHAQVHLSALMNILRQVSGHALIPDRVLFTFEAPAARDEYERIFGPNLYFGQPENALVFLERSLTLPIVTSNPSMLRFFEAQAQALLDDLEPRSWHARLKHVLLKNLGTGEIAIEDAARELGVSVRTLQYHLKSESKSYRESLDAVRKKLAGHYVQNTAMDFSAIAMLLHYAEPSPFFRAFKRWYGTTPKRLRETAKTR